MENNKRYNKQLIEDFCTALKIDKEKDIFIYDPLVIHRPDLEAVGIKNLVRVRRPHWGKGNVGNFVKKVGYEEFKNCLVLEEEEDVSRRNETDSE